MPDEIVDRFCLLGPASAHVDRLRELAEAGADQFAVYLMHDQEEDTLAAYGETIIPSLKALFRTRQSYQSPAVPKTVDVWPANHIP